MGCAPCTGPTTGGRASVKEGKAIRGQSQEQMGLLWPRSEATEAAAEAVSTASTKTSSPTLVRLRTGCLAVPVACRAKGRNCTVVPPARGTRYRDLQVASRIVLTVCRARTATLRVHAAPTASRACDSDVETCQLGTAQQAWHVWTAARVGCIVVGANRLAADTWEAAGPKGYLS